MPLLPEGAPQEKAKPAVTRGRKATDPSLDSRVTLIIMKVARLFYFQQVPFIKQGGDAKTGVSSCRGEASEGHFET